MVLIRCLAAQHIPRPHQLANATLFTTYLIRALTAGGRGAGFVATFVTIEAAGRNADVIAPLLLVPAATAALLPRAACCEEDAAVAAAIAGVQTLARTSNPRPRSPVPLLH